MSIDATFYSGPKIQSELKDLAVGLNQTVDYGWLYQLPNYYLQVYSSSITLWVTGVGQSFY